MEFSTNSLRGFEGGLHLRGSEHHNPYQPRSSVFLSCLRGSERRAVPQQGGCAFLSCLRGSEPSRSARRGCRTFLLIRPNEV